MKTTKIAKADPIGDGEVRPVTIVIDDQIPQHASLDFDIENYYNDQAKELARVLFNSLPQGTMDRLIIALLKRKTSVYRGLTGS